MAAILDISAFERLKMRIIDILGLIWPWPWKWTQFDLWGIRDVKK